MRFVKIISLILLLAITSGFVYSDTTLLYKLDYLTVVGFSKRNAIAYDLRYGGNHLRLINMDTGKQVTWPDEADIYKLGKTYQQSDAFFQYQASILAKDENSVKAYDILSGKLLWENKNINYISMLFVVKDGVGYTLDYYADSIIHLYSINMNNGVLVDHYDLSIGKDKYSRKLYDIKDDCALIQVDMDMIYYNFKTDKTIWKYKLQPYSSKARLVGNYIIASTTDYSELCSELIYCVDLTTGKEVWNTQGSPDYAIIDGYIYYYLGDTRCNNVTKPAIIKREISTGKIIKKNENGSVYRIGNIYNYNGNILYFNSVQSNNNADWKYQLYDHDLNVVNEASICDVHKYEYNYNFSDSHVYGDYFVSSFRDRTTQRYITFCNSLPDYKPPEVPMSLIEQLIRFILNKLVIP